jgi:glutathione S-transferase
MPNLFICQDSEADRPCQLKGPFMTSTYRLFAWNFSYFSAKVRAYMNYKRHVANLRFEEILATQDIIQGLLIPNTGSNVVPQLQTPAGIWVQDSSEIIDHLESAFPEAPVIPTSPKQKLVSYLLEILADEWMLPWGFWERWHYSLRDVEPNHEAFNAQQWGRIFNASGSGQERRDAGRFIFKEIMKIDAPHEAEFGPYAGLIQLGVTEDTQQAWTESMHRMLAILETHLGHHDYILGGAPTLADFALLGPLYPHVYKDPVPGFMIRTQYPLVSEWIERANGSQEAGYKSYKEPQYKLEDGALVPEAAGKTLSDDEIPDTLLPLVEVFFDEMWPMLKNNIAAVEAYIQSDACKDNTSLPHKSFYSPVEFKSLQSGGGPLTLEFEIGGVKEKRMASPYQVWMLQRIEKAIANDVNQSASNTELMKFLGAFPGGQELLALKDRLARCPIEKKFEQLFAASKK